MHSSSIKTLGITLIALLAVLAFLKTPNISAQTTIAACPAGTQLYGWAWSSTIGWISFNSRNAGGEGGNHCVSIDANNNVVGWAWSSNIGWIKFGGLSGFPVTGNSDGDAKKTDNRFTGWSRACAGTVAGDCSSMVSRTDGWDGWIELSGLNHTLTYDGTAGTVTGFAWGSDVVGWTSFNLYTRDVNEPPPPPPPASCTFSGSPIGTTGAHRLQWEARGMDSCSGAGIGFNPNSLSGTAEVTPPASTTYSLSCRPASNPSANPTLCGSYPVNVGGGGVVTPGTTPAIQMWLNNDDSEALSFIRIRPGAQARVNWKKTDGAEYSSCVAQVDSSFLTEDEGFDANPDENGTPYVIPTNFLPIGEHLFSMSCETPDGVMVAGKTLSNSTTLNIRVVDPRIEEI